jgi:hypothetical protein
MKPASKHEERLSPRQSHGIKALKRAVSTLGSRTIDKRTQVGKALAAWRAELIADLGGIENVSTQELALVDEAVKTKLILDSVDAWVLAQASLIDKRKRTVLPVVRDRNSLVSTLRQLLNDLGLRRRAIEAPDLGAYLASRKPRGSDDGCHIAQEGHAQGVEPFATDGPLRVIKADGDGDAAAAEVQP